MLTVAWNERSSYGASFIWECERIWNVCHRGSRSYVISLFYCGFFFFYIYIKTPWLGHLIVFVSQTELRHCFIFTRLTNSLLYLWLTRWWSTRGTATGSTAGDTTSSNPLPRKDIPRIYLVSGLHPAPLYFKTCCAHKFVPSFACK